ncbi:MAG: polysaccharide biosynthesis protein [Mucilaginibacter sp.]|nr:polysaccharide biosynthesis protein [Mucilaginibacter sp.]
MINKLQSKNPFFKNVSTLALGTIVSQFILFASSPLLSRLFTPSNFGVLSIFTSVGSMAAIITTGRYELTIGLPEKDEDGANLTTLVIFLSGIVSAFYLFFIFFIKYIGINSLENAQLINSSAAYLIPIFTFLAGIYSAFQYWNQRKKNYRLIAWSNAAQVLGATLFNIIFGLIGFKAFGLIWGALIGLFCACIALLFTFYNSGYFKKISFSEFKLNARRYIAFPKYMIISDFSVTTSQQIVPIIFSIIFNVSIVGFFSMANRMLRIPSIVLTSSIGNVFRNEAIDTIRKSGNCQHLYLSTLKKLVILSVPIYMVIFIAAPRLFEIFFGKNWVQAGDFAQIICIMLVFDFIAFPLNGLFYVLNKQKTYMSLQFLNGIMGIVIIFLANIFFGGPFYSILFFALNSVVFSLLSIYMTYNFSKHTYII